MAGTATDARLDVSDLIKLSNGVNLNVWQGGRADELVVFLHAVGGDHRSWAPQLDAFKDKYTCVALDFRGHGKSTAPANAPIDVQSFAEDVCLLIQRLGYARAHLVGLSMGAVVAMEVFRIAPNVVQSLALANTWSFQPDGEARISFMEKRLETMTVAVSAQEMMPGLFSKDAPEKLIDEAAAIEGSKDKDVFLSSWRSMFKVDFRKLLPEIDVPVLLIGGTEDSVTPTNPLLTEMHRLIHMAWLVDIEGAGHFSNLDHSGEFNRLLKIHLNRGRRLPSARISPVELRTLSLPCETTAEGLIYMLSKRGVDCFFSNSGTDFTPIIDALAKFSDDPNFKLRTITVPHENTAVAMAHGHFLLSGRAQVTMAHVNVGTANMGLGIINAARSRVPMLVMSGKTPSFESGVPGCRTNFVQWGQDTFDQAAYFREFTKWDYELKRPHNLETVVDRALAIAQSDPAGPVYLTLPKEPLCEPIPQLKINASPRQQANPPSIADASSLERAARAIASCVNPFIITSELGRYRQGPEELVQLARLCALPVIEFGKKNFFNFPTDHQMHIGFTPYPYVEESDLLIALECHVPWIPSHGKMNTPPTLLQIGIDPLFHKIPMRSFPSDISLAGDPALTLRALRIRMAEMIKEDEGLRKRIEKRAQTLSHEHRKIFENARDEAAADSKAKAITKRYLSFCIGNLVDDECIIFNEYDLDPLLVPRRLPDSWFENSVASGLGWSLGAALGAQLASPERTMIVTLGDGSYLFNTPLSAHFVAAANQLPIMIIVFNDSAWSTIKKSTKGSSPDGWAAKKNNFALCDFDLSVQFEKLAESCGGIGLTVSDPRELPDRLAEGLRIVRRERKHVLVNVTCERDG